MVDAPRAVNEATQQNAVDLGDLCPGWHTQRITGRLVARRLARLSDYQLSQGCLGELSAPTAGELVILCDAHDHLAGKVALAETLARTSQKIHAAREVDGPRS